MKLIVNLRRESTVQRMHRNSEQEYIFFAIKFAVFFYFLEGWVQHLSACLVFRAILSLGTYGIKYALVKTCMLY
jgi:hypothetical protein